MEIRFDNQVVLITGASTGIGAAVARAFGQAGARVVVNYNQSEAAARAVADDIQTRGGQALLVQADVTDLAQIDRLVQASLAQFDRIDVLVNNAGALVQREFIADMSDELYRRIMDLNMTSVFQVCRQVIPIMQRQGGGRIINVTSIAARNGGAGGSA